MINAHVIQSAEITDLKSVKCEFESRHGHQKCGVGILVVSQPSKLVKRVRFSHTAPIYYDTRSIQ